MPRSSGSRRCSSSGPGRAASSCWLAGCAVATVVTWLARGHVPFPTYTAPFIVTTWVLFLVGTVLGIPASNRADPWRGRLARRRRPRRQPGDVPGEHRGRHSCSSPASRSSDWKHASWVLLGSIVGMLVGSYHATAAADALDPESLVDRGLLDNVGSGAVRLQRDAGGRRPVPVEAVAVSRRCWACSCSRSCSPI